MEYSVNGGVFMSYRDRTTLSMVIQNTQYADDLTLVAESRAGIQNMLNVLDSCCKKWGMKINSSKTKVKSLVMSVLLYGSETWPMSQQNIRKLKTFQMRCLRDILGFTLLDKKRNEDILKLSGQIPIEDELRKKR